MWEGIENWWWESGFWVFGVVLKLCKFICLLLVCKYIVISKFNEIEYRILVIFNLRFGIINKIWYIFNFVSIILIIVIF